MILPRMGWAAEKERGSQSPCEGAELGSTQER